MNELQLEIKVIPNAPKTELVGVLSNGVLKIKLKAAPEKGKANQELVKYLHTIFNIDQNQIEIVAGHTARLKHVRLIGVGEKKLQELLQKFDRAT